MKQKLTILSTLLLWLFVVSSCQEDQQEQVFPDFESTESIVTLKSTPELINVFNNFPGNTGLFNARGESTEFDENTQLATMDFGTLDLSAIRQLISEAEQPNPNYTIRLYPPENVTNSLEYLVLIGADGGYVAQIHQYKTDIAHIATLFDKSSFTGTFRVLDLERNVFSTTEYENGVQLVDSSDNTAEEDANNGREDIEIVLPFGCKCHTEWKVVGVDVHSGMSAHGNYEKVAIHCDCSGSGEIDYSTGSGTGRPGNFVGDGTGFSSGGGSGGGRGPSSDVLPPNPSGNDDLIILPNVPEHIIEIYADEVFMRAFEETLRCPPEGFRPIPWQQVDYKVVELIYNGFIKFGERLLRATLKEQYHLLLSDDPEVALERFQTLLDAAGLVPYAGEVADGANLVIYTAKGDTFNATLSGFSLVPVAGDGVAKGLKYSLKIIEKTAAGRVIVKGVRELNVSQLEDLLRTISNIPVGQLKKFFKDLVANPEIMGKIISNPRIVDAWNALSDFRYSTSIRRSTEALEEVAQGLDEGLDALDALDDAIEVVGKPQPTWPEIKALFKRGNDFNKKARRIYQFNEVTLKNGKRLDSYVPGKEIISRKATTLSNIKPETFKGYLRELINKYPVGAKINAPKFGKRFEGLSLAGDYFLEIPTSNRSFFQNSSTFQKILSDFNKDNKVKIAIKYLNE